MERRSCFERDELERDDSLLAWRQRALEKRRRTGSGAAPARGCALSQFASISPPAARRQTEQGTGPGLGAEPLLLPEHNSNQGCGGDLAVPRPRHPARMAPPDRRSLRQSRPAEPHRTMAETEQNTPTALCFLSFPPSTSS